MSLIRRFVKNWSTMDRGGAKCQRFPIGPFGHKPLRGEKDVRDRFGLCACCCCVKMDLLLSVVAKNSG